MGWKMPWYTITDSFDADFGVDEWHGHNVFFRDGERVFRTYFINSRGDEAMGTTWSYLDITPLGRQETWEDSPEGYPQSPPYKWWNWHDNYDAEAAPHPKWVEVSNAGETPSESATQRTQSLCSEGENDGTAQGMRTYWLSLAAAPTFAIMAFITAAFSGGPQDMFCAAAHQASPLNGMAWMYLLMSAFHSAPWLKLMSGRRSGAQRS